MDIHMTLKTQLALTPKPPFDFARTAYSHGWVVLDPNQWDDKNHSIHRIEMLAAKQVVLLQIEGSDSVEEPEIRIQVEHKRQLSITEEDMVRERVSHMLRVDEDLSEFYALCEQRGGHWKKVTAGLGRLLRSPSLFEDIVKTILTTNIQWGGTKRMVRELVDAFGEPYPGQPELKAFPTPESIAAVSFETFQEKVRMGYRAPFIHQLAQNVAGGELDLSAFINHDIPTADLKKKLLGIKGVGNYAAASLLMVLGRYDDIPVDTVFREFVSKKYFNGEKPDDQTAKALYDDWGQWKYLAYWFDLWQGLNEEL
jgi:3-methyladenine DNA glycosylase/8-oxoguanine DNA glycosylase